MALTLTELETRRTQLQAIRFSPVRKVKFENGVELTYNSPEEVAQALQAVEAAIAAENGEVSPRFIRTSLGSGYGG